MSGSRTKTAPEVDVPGPKSRRKAYTKNLNPAVKAGLANTDEMRAANKVKAAANKKIREDRRFAKELRLKNLELAPADIARTQDVSIADENAERRMMLDPKAAARRRLPSPFEPATVKCSDGTDGLGAASEDDSGESEVPDASDNDDDEEEEEEQLENASSDVSSDGERGAKEALPRAADKVLCSLPPHKLLHILKRLYSSPALQASAPR
jgi:hypothetical protein